ncbi:MAG: ergothioneine biosynthesis protein EgtB [Bacteroidetes bacterium]|nr:MAG: ergothioneine biosynthesis protein EgtB [Bacteroidota bacterium]
MLDYFLKTRAWTKQLIEPLQTEDCVLQPVQEVSPPKWHMAHTSWFFEEFVLKPFVKDYKVFSEDYAYLFNSYYNHVGQRNPRDNRGSISRPSTKVIRQYRQHVTEAVSLFWKQLQEHKDWPEISRRLEIGINHEQQHQELLLTDIKYILGTQPFYPLYVEEGAPDCDWSAEKALEWNRVEEGMYLIGHEGNDFCFDNEKGAHDVFLESFEIADRAVRNDEYLEFIEAGAYQDFQWWLAEGWDWVLANQMDSPLYWVKKEDQWFRYSLSGLIPLEPFGPLMHVNYYEADAFARWKGARLPTEFEWEAAFQINPDWMYSPVWEWTASAYLPYPGFKTEPGALGEYNGKFMVNQMVLRGGSLATPEGHWRPSYRNFFHPHLQWQFSGIRLVR